MRSIDANRRNQTYLAIIGLVAFISAATAATEEELKTRLQDCSEYWVSSTAAIDACSWLITGGYLDPDNLTRAIEKRGAAYLLDEQNELAADDFTRAIERGTQDLVSWRNRALAYRRLGKLSEAITDYSRLIDNDQQDPTLYFDRGITYLRMQQLTQAGKDFNRAQTLDRSLLVNLVDKAKGHASKNEHGKALEAWKIAAIIDPKNADYLSEQCFSLFKLKQNREAQSACEQALVIDPNHATTHANYAVTFVNLGQYDRAHQLFNRAQALDPSLDAAYTNQAAVYRHTGNPEKTLATLTAGKAANPNSGRIMGALGEHYLFIREYDKAIEAHKQAIAYLPEDSPQKGEAYLGLATALSYQSSSQSSTDGDTQENRERMQTVITDLFDNARRLRPWDSEVYIQRAGHWFRAGKVDLARKELDDFIATGAGDYRIYWQRARLWNHLDEFARAYDDYAAAARLNPRSAAIHNDMCWVAARHLEKFAEAKQACLTALALNPTSHHVMHSIGYIYTQLGEYETATDFLEKALTLSPGNEVYERDLLKARAQL